MIEQKNIGGKLNTDSSPYKVPSEDYIDALNITRDSQAELKDDIVTNIVGNQLVPYTQPAGINKTIGSHSDPVRDRVYNFVYNSNGNHYISYWDRSSNTIIKLIQDLTDTNNIPVLKFNPSYRINHIDIINIDTTGDLLFWTDGLNAPRKINVLTATSGGYTPFILESFINVIKAPPTIPPSVVYINDTAVTVNNLQKKLFVFKYRFIYDDLEKSVPSSQSVMPLPILSTNPSVNQDPTKNCGINMVFQTGLSNVKKIELWGAQSIGNEFGEFFIIDVLNKSQLNIPDDDLFSYTFYNNQAYAFADPTEAAQILDYVPLAAKSQVLLNGNVLAYAATKENYDLLPSTDGILGAVSTNISNVYQTTEILVGYNARSIFNGFQYIRIYVAGIVSQGDTFTLNVRVNNTDHFISYTSTILNETISHILQELSAQLITIGFTFLEQGDNYIFMSATGGQVLNTRIIAGINNNIGNNSVGCYDWNSHYQIYGVYFDENGQTNGAQGNLLGSVITPNYSESAGIPTLPIINLSILYRPPIWAKYFQIVRTNNLTKSYSEYWISNKTYKDQTANNQGYQYAYISISSINQFVIDNPSTGSQLTYGFTTNDRIRFVKRFNLNGSTENIYQYNDFEIQDSLINPVINGIQQEGQFLKIILPATADNFNFGTVFFANYLINIYTPALSSSNNLNLYYEFGKECYQIGNSGTVNAFHYGYNQNQSPDLAVPATFILSNNGDAYYRTRYIPTGNEIKYLGTVGFTSFHLRALPLDLQSVSFSDDNYTIQSQNDADPSVSTGTITVTAVPPYQIAFDITGSFTFTAGQTINEVVSVYAYIYGTDNNVNLIQNLYNQFMSITAGENYTIPLGGRVFLENDVAHKLVIVVSSQFTGQTFKIVSLPITLQEVTAIPSQGIIDYNFSDYYPSKVNSNGRAFIYDSNAKQQYNPVLIRNGQTFEFGTNINGINRFYGTNFDQYDRSLGSIKKLFIEGRNLYVFQEFDTGLVPVLQQMIQDTENNPLGAQSQKILNNIQYPFKGKFGIGNLPESFAYYNYAKYFVDNNKNAVIRISQDGLINISHEFEMDAYFVSKLKAYQIGLNNGNGASGQPYLGNPTVYGVFDYYTKKYIVALEEINRYDSEGNIIFHQDAATLTFNEVRDTKEGFESPVSFAPENMVSINTLLCTFKNGQLWSHDNTAAMANFYGVQYPAYIILVFNKDVAVKKTFLAVSYQGNTYWVSPTNGDVYTSMINQQTGLPQISQLIAVDYQISEGLYYAALNRDANSGTDPIIAVLEGDYLKGNWMAIKFSYTGSNPVQFLMPYVEYILSGRNG